MKSFGVEFLDSQAVHVLALEIRNHLKNLNFSVTAVLNTGHRGGYGYGIGVLVGVSGAAYFERPSFYSFQITHANNEVLNVDVIALRHVKIYNPAGTVMLVLGEDNEINLLTPDMRSFEQIKKTVFHPDRRAIIAVEHITQEIQNYLKPNSVKMLLDLAESK